MWTVTFNDELIQNGLTDTDWRLCRKCYRLSCNCQKDAQAAASSQGKRKTKEETAAMVARIKKKALQRHNDQRR